MDIRLLAIIALIVALMEILGKLARKRAASEAEDGSRPARVDPFASVMEELEWLPMDDDQAVKPTPARAAPVPERPVPVAELEPPVWPPPREAEPPVWPSPTREAAPPVWPPPTRGIEPPVRPSPRAVESAPPPRRTVEPALPPGRAPRVQEYRDRAPREIKVHSREARPSAPRRSVPDRRIDEVRVPVVARRAAEGAAARGAGPEQPVIPGVGRGEGLGLRSVSGLRRLVVAREVLGPPLALRDEERR